MSRLDPVYGLTPYMVYSPYTHQNDFMMLRNTIRSWGTVARLLHWGLAAIIFVQVLLGFLAANWRLSPTKLDLFVWHKSVGMLVLLLVIARLLWRLMNPTPQLPDGVPVWERQAARVNQAILYILMFCLPLSGWVINSAANIPFKIFWLMPLPLITAPDKLLEEQAKTLHAIFLLCLLVALLVHVAAALRHHFQKRNDVLRRMLPWPGDK